MTFSDFPGTPQKKKKWNQACFEFTLTQQDDIEGFQPEWYISTTYHAWDTPFWLGILDISHANIQLL